MTRTEFPLPPGYFNDVVVSDAQRRHLTQFVRHRLNSMLEDERRHLDRLSVHGVPGVHPGEWAPVVRNKNVMGLHVFKRNRRNRSLRELAMEEDFAEARWAAATGHPSVLAVGYVPGTIENMMYGMTATSEADLRTGFSFYDTPPKDCALLGHLEHSTADDPFHSADFIWALPRLPRFVDQVDVCYLKGTGTGIDHDGKRYAYLVLHSVDLAECPPFSRITRARMYFSCLFRETDCGFLHVLGRGIFNLEASRTLQFMLPHVTTSFMTGLFNGVGIGESKKLTLMAQRSRLYHALSPVPGLSFCSVCFKSRSFWNRKLAQCAVCNLTICSKCLAKENPDKKKLFLGFKAPWVQCKCCAGCVKQALHTTGVRPCEPEFEVVADYYLKHRSMPRMSSLLSTKDKAPIGLSPTSMLTRLLTTSSGLRTNSTSHDSLLEGTFFADASTSSESKHSFCSGVEDDDDFELDCVSPNALSCPDWGEITIWENGARLSMDSDFTFSPNGVRISETLPADESFNELVEKIREENGMATEAYEAKHPNKPRSSR